MFSEATGSSLDKLEMIDSMQRLGFAYHFEDEINEALKSIYNNHSQLRSGTEKKLEDLRAVAFEFRLLRQHRYNINVIYIILRVYVKVLNGPYTLETNQILFID